MRFPLRGQRFWPFHAIIALLVFLSGCGGGDSGTKTRNQTLAPPATFEGRLLDNAVQGLRYTTRNRSGFTRSSGAFIYEDGDLVTFRLGDIILGSAPAKPVLTPIDLVAGAEDEFHPDVTNMVRLLLSLDVDCSPDNGIFIPDETRLAATDRAVDWSTPVDDFGGDPDVLDLLAAAGDCPNGARQLVGVDDARTHLRATLDEIAGKNGGGTGEDCRYLVPDAAITVSSDPDDPDQLTVLLADHSIPRSCAASVTNGTATIFWGDGTASEEVAVVVGETVLSHTYQNSGSYSISYIFHDTAARKNNTSERVTVENPNDPGGGGGGGDGDCRYLAPDAAITVSLDPDDLNELTVLLADHSTPNSCEASTSEGTATIFWGDGSADEAVDVVVGETVLSHTYQRSGGYSISYIFYDTAGRKNNTSERITVENPNDTGEGGGGGGGGDCRYLVPDVSISVSLDPADPNQLTVVLADHSTPRSCEALPDAGTANIFWGDGVTENDVPIMPGETVLRHAYRYSGSYSVSYIFYDTFGRRNSISERITVENPNDTGGGGSGGGGADCRYLIPAVAITATQGGMTVTIRDQSQPQSCAASPFFGTANIFWGDGTKDENIPIRVGVTEISHTFMVPGSYTIGYTFYDTFGKKGYVTQRVTVP